LIRFSKIVRLLCVLAAAGVLLLTITIFVRRMIYPYDLEWMEGGMLCHSLRLLEGQPIYARPSVEFIPYLYTPLYPVLLAGLAKVIGLGYGMARFVSIASYLGASFLAYRFAVRLGGSRAASLSAMAIPAAAWVGTGSFYDLARPDSLWLFLTTAAVILLYRGARDLSGERRSDRKRHLSIALSAVLFVAAFFTKQTAAPFMIAGGVALIFLDWRTVPTYGLTLAILGLPSLWLANRMSDGWFWTYIQKLHQAHDFNYRHALRDTPIHLAAMVGPSLLLLPWALWRRRSTGMIYASLIALVAIASACLAFGTQWAYANAYIPGVFFPSLAIAIAGGRLVTPAQPAPDSSFRGATAVPRLRPAVVFGLVAVSLALNRYDPRRACDTENNCRPLVPSAADREAGDRLIARLRAVDGEVLIPFHPFYAHLAGKHTYVHRMGVMDVTPTLGTPAGLTEGIRDHRWKLAIFDYKVGDRGGGGTWFQWPGMLANYRIEAPDPDGPPTVSGAPTAPSYALVPKLPPAGIDRELQ
jgi:hypothetical protein